MGSCWPWDCVDNPLVLADEGDILARGARYHPGIDASEPKDNT